MHNHVFIQWCYNTSLCPEKPWTIPGAVYLYLCVVSLLTVLVWLYMDIKTQIHWKCKCKMHFFEPRSFLLEPHFCLSAVTLKKKIYITCCQNSTFWVDSMWGDKLFDNHNMDWRGLYGLWFLKGIITQLSKYDLTNLKCTLLRILKKVQHLLQQTNTMRCRTVIWTGCLMYKPWWVKIDLDCLMCWSIIGTPWWHGTPDLKQNILSNKRKITKFSQDNKMINFWSRDNGI